MVSLLFMCILFCSLHKLSLIMFNGYYEWGYYGHKLKHIIILLSNYQNFAIIFTEGICYSQNYAGILA